MQRVHIDRKTNSEYTSIENAHANFYSGEFYLTYAQTANFGHCIAVGDMRTKLSTVRNALKRPKMLHFILFDHAETWLSRLMIFSQMLSNLPIIL